MKIIKSKNALGLVILLLVLSLMMLYIRFVLGPTVEIDQGPSRIVNGIEPYATSGGFSGSPISKSCGCIGNKFASDPSASSINDSPTYHYCDGTLVDCKCLDKERYWDDAYEWSQSGQGEEKGLFESNISTDDYYIECE